MADEQKLRGKKARMRCRACDTLWVVEGPPLEPDSELAVTNEAPASPSYHPAGPSYHPGQDAGYAVHDSGNSSANKAHAAVVRRGTERERRDLFATRPPDVGSIRQTLRPPPSSSLPPPPPSVGARNEDSVLFRVDQLRATGALKSTAPPPGGGSSISSPPRSPSFAPGPSVAPPSFAPGPSVAPPAPSFAVAGDDEGMIDLMALSTRAPKPAGAPVAPLFSDAPGAFARDASSSDAAQNRAKNRNILIGGIVGAVGVVALAVIGVVWAFRDDPRPRILTAALPPVHVSVPVQTAPPPAPPADPAAAVAANNDDEGTHAKGKKGKGKGKAWVAAGMKRGGPAKETSTAAPPPPKRAPKAADPCGCKGDFNCILSCSAKGHK